MSALSVILYIVGILALIEGCFVIFFPKPTLKIFRWFARNAEKHLKFWGIGEVIIAIILILLARVL